MTPTAIFLGATAMTTGAGADTVERPSESEAPGMKAEPMSEGTRSMLRETDEGKSESAPKDVELGTCKGAIISFLRAFATRACGFFCEWFCHGAVLVRRQGLSGGNVPCRRAPARARRARRLPQARRGPTQRGAPPRQARAQARAQAVARAALGARARRRQDRGVPSVPGTRSAHLGTLGSIRCARPPHPPQAFAPSTLLHAPSTPSAPRRCLSPQWPSACSPCWAAC